MARTRTLRIGRNDPCWCGSDRKYKHCHQNRRHEVPLPTGQFRAMVDSRFGENRICLHPDAPMGCGKVIRALTLQRSGIIKRLVGTDNHVRSFYPLEWDQQGNPKIHRIGWRNASTFSGFCDKHDGQLFSAIENQPFVGSDRQVFLIGYRALCHELYQKQAATDLEPVLAENLDRGGLESDQQVTQTKLAISSAGRRAGLQEVRVLKSTFDQILRIEDYGGLHTAVLWFRRARAWPAQAWYTWNSISAARDCKTSPRIYPQFTG